jgi:hypothetical protein
MSAECLIEAEGCREVTAESNTMRAVRPGQGATLLNLSRKLNSSPGGQKPGYGLAPRGVGSNHVSLPGTARNIYDAGDEVRISRPNAVAGKAYCSANPSQAGNQDKAK